MTESKFKWLIRITIIMGIISAVLYEITFYQLPNELRYFIIKAEQKQENLTLIWAIIFSIIVLSLLVYLIFVFSAMFKLKRYARTHAIILTCLAVLSYLLLDPEINTGLVSIFNELASILWGVILGSMYFSDIKNHFEKKIDA